MVWLVWFQRRGLVHGRWWILDHPHRGRLLTWIHHWLHTLCRHLSHHRLETTHGLHFWILSIWCHRQWLLWSAISPWNRWNTTTILTLWNSCIIHSIYFIQILYFLLFLQSLLIFILPLFKWGLLLHVNIFELYMLIALVDRLLVSRLSIIVLRIENVEYYTWNKSYFISIPLYLLLLVLTLF